MATPEQTAPLRRIIGTRRTELPGGSLHRIAVEVLECGHEQAVKQDIYGDTHPVRRRCRKCVPADLPDDRKTA